MSYPNPLLKEMIMWNDDEQEFTSCDWRDSAPVEYITESEDYYSDEDDSDDPCLDGWDDEDLDDDPEYDYPGLDDQHDY